MIKQTTQEVLQEAEDSWNLWFGCLPIWDQRTVMRNELEWHDEFVAGVLSFQELRGKILDARGEVSERAHV